MVIAERTYSAEEPDWFADAAEVDFLGDMVEELQELSSVWDEVPVEVTPALPEPVPVPVHTWNVRSQKNRVKDGKPTAGETGREGINKRKRGFHAELGRLLEAMGAGDFGKAGEKLAEKWDVKVSLCPGRVRTHRACDLLSFLSQSCHFELCPWCQASKAKRRARGIMPVLETFKAPKFWTFTGGPNHEELTGSVLSAVVGAAVALHRRKYIADRCRGGFRKPEITNKGKGWNVHVHELVDADWVSMWPLSDIARPGPAFKPYTGVDRLYSIGLRRRTFGDCTPKSCHGAPHVNCGPVTKRPYPKGVVKHPGLAALYTECAQKYPELKADGVRWNGFPVFAKDNPESWFIADVRVADYSADAEIAKYIAKGNELVTAGGRAVLEYIAAIKGKQLIKGFGCAYGLGNLDDEEKNPVDEDSKGDCPWLECPEPDLNDWKVTSLGFPDPEEYRMERNPRTGTHRVLAWDAPAPSTISGAVRAEQQRYYKAHWAEDGKQRKAEAKRKREDGVKAAAESKRQRAEAEEVRRSRGEQMGMEWQSGTQNKSTEVPTMVDTATIEVNGEVIEFIALSPVAAECPECDSGRGYGCEGMERGQYHPGAVVAASEATVKEGEKLRKDMERFPNAIFSNIVSRTPCKLQQAEAEEISRSVGEQVKLMGEEEYGDWVFEVHCGHLVD